MESITIAFPNGNRARAVCPPTDADGGAIAAALDLPPPQAILMLSGGASNMSAAEIKRLRSLLTDGVVRVAAEEHITVIDGGTRAGVMQMMGEGRAIWGGDAPLIGVCPRALVTWPGVPDGEDSVPLESHHTHFVLTDGGDWGAETETILALTAFLSTDVPSLALLANGGAVAWEEVLHNARQARQIIVIRGSGRLADEIASAVRGDVMPSDEEMEAIVRQSYIALFDISEGPEALAAEIRRKLRAEVLA